MIPSMNTKSNAMQHDLSTVSLWGETGSSPIHINKPNPEESIDLADEKPSR